MKHSTLLLCVFIIALAATQLEAAPPKVLDDQLQLELFAESPEIVTPIGCCFDAKGRLLVIESHTHHRDRNLPEDEEPYSGPAKDRIRIIEDTDNDGRADSFRTFYEGTEFTMSLARGDDGWIYVATRAKIFRIRDTDNDDVADEEQPIAHLETKGDYPHNGLSGLMLDGKGSLYFGLGENLGAEYRLVGHDGASQRGSGEGGIFRCDLEGNNLARVATGFGIPSEFAKTSTIAYSPSETIQTVGHRADWCKSTKRPITASSSATVDRAAIPFRLGTGNYQVRCP